MLGGDRGLVCVCVCVVRVPLRLVVVVEVLRRRIYTPGITGKRPHAGHVFAMAVAMMGKDAFVWTGIYSEKASEKCRL